jgi:hypothetical protein
VGPCFSLRIQLLSDQRANNRNVQQKVPQMWQQQDSDGLSSNALVSANVWHPQSFMRSLQLVIYRIRISLDRPAQGKKTKLVVHAQQRPFCS